MRNRQGGGYYILEVCKTKNGDMEFRFKMIDANFTLKV